MSILVAVRNFGAPILLGSRNDSPGEFPDMLKPTPVVLNGPSRRYPLGQIPLVCSGPDSYFGESSQSRKNLPLNRCRAAREHETACGSVYGLQNGGKGASQAAVM